MGGAVPAATATLHAPSDAAALPTAPAAPVIAATPPGAALQLGASAITHAGLVRSNNEDSVLLRIPDDSQLLLDRGALFAVADGVGGQSAGEVASRTAVELLAQEYFSPRAPHQLEAALRQAMHAANLAVCTLAHGPDPALRAMQTTLAAVAIAGRQAYLAHAGDTRIYLIRDRSVTQLTGDHSEAAELLRLRLITAEQAQAHPRRSVLTRALGASPQMRPDFQRVPLQPGDRFLICSDGLWSDVPPDVLEQTLVTNGSGPESLCHALLTLALERGGGDNVSHVLIDVVDPGPGAPAQPAGRIGRLLAGLRGG